MAGQAADAFGDGKNDNNCGFFYFKISMEMLVGNYPYWIMQ
jgi:hypothetical protein